MKNFYTTLKMTIDKENKEDAGALPQSTQPAPAKCSCLFPLPLADIRVADFLLHVIQLDYRSCAAHTTNQEAGLLKTKI